MTNDENPSELILTTRHGLPEDALGALQLLEEPTGVHPVTNYLERLARGSRRTMSQSLDRIAQMFIGSTEVNALLLNWSALRYEHTSWIRSRLEDELAPATANKAMAALRGVLKEAWRLGYMAAEDYHRAIDIGTVKGFRLPRGRRLKVGEMRAFFESCASDRNVGAVLDAAIFAAMAGGGLRRDEAAWLGMEDFRADDQVLRVIGKGDKEREVPLQSNVTAALNLWVNVRGFEEGAFFCPVRKNGAIEIRHMSDQALYRRLGRRSLKAGIKKFTPHDLRRTYASGMLDAGADVFAVQKLLGHSEVKTTGRYDLRDEKAKRKAADLFHVPYVAFEPEYGDPS